MVRTRLREVSALEGKGAEGLEERVDVGRAGGPVGGDADEVCIGRERLPDIEEEVLLQGSELGAGEDWEELVCRRVDVERNIALAESLADAVSLADGVLCQVEVERVGEERAELDAKEIAFGEECAALLHDIAEVLFEGRVGDDQCLAHQSAAFRASDIEGVGEGGEGWERDVAARGGEGIRETCAVDVEEDSVASADVGEGLDLGERVDGAKFGGQ